jgi:hypothetical protein
MARGSGFRADLIAALEGFDEALRHARLRGPARGLAAVCWELRGGLDAPLPHMRSRVRGLGGAGAHGGWLRTGTAINWHLRVGGGAIPSSSSSACALAVRQSVMLSRILGIRCASGSWEFPANDGIQCGLHRVDTVPAFKPPVENPKSSGPINLNISHFFTYTVHQRAASSPQFADSSG